MPGLVGAASPCGLQQRFAGLFGGALPVERRPPGVCCFTVLFLVLAAGPFPAPSLGGGSFLEAPASWARSDQRKNRPVRVRIVIRGGGHCGRTDRGVA